MGRLFTSNERLRGINMNQLTRAEEALENRQETSEEDNREQLTYAEIFSNLLLNSEFHIIIAAENEKDVKVGLKNIKARQASKLKEDGLPPSPEVLAFSSRPHPTIPGAVSLKITLKPVASVEVFGTYVPDNTF